MAKLEYYYTASSSGGIIPVKIVVNGKEYFFSRETDTIDFSPMSQYRGSKISFYKNGKFEKEYQFLGLIYKDGKVIGFNYDEDINLEG